MTPSSERWEQARELFDAARALPSERRDALLRAACSDDELRAEVEALLRAHEALQAGDGGGFLGALDVPRAAALLAPADEADGAADPEGLAAGAPVGRYRVVRPLGRGGMGVVYLAHDPRLDRPVALKLLPRHLSLDDLARRRFEEEARAASALDHPHIATVYEIGETADGRVFLAMAYYEGETLQQRLERGGPLPVGAAVALAAQITDGLCAAHARGIVHRDIKPGNVIVSSESVATIVDFGIAKISGSLLTQTGATVGTVAYMSPEQTHGDLVDARTDLWSLGVVLYEMLTGQRPFRAANEQALIYAIRHDDPEPLGRARPEVPRALADVVERCLRKDPAERYTGADALLAELRAFQQAPATADAGPLRKRALPPRYGGVLGLVVLLLAGGVALRSSVQGGDAAAEPPAQSRALAPTRLAVLPLADLSPDAEDAYLADGLSEELISHLSQVHSLRVLAWSSSMRYREPEKEVAEIGRELDVEAVLQGSVHQAGDRLRVAVALVDASSAEQLWAEEYESTLGEVGKLPREIVRGVAERLNVRIPAGAPLALAPAQAVDGEAYRLYLQGRYLLGNLDTVSFRRARDFFQQALELDPGFARAWSGLADAYDHLAAQSALPSGDAFPRARAAAERALELDPDLPEAHASLGRTLAWYFWDTERAGRHFRRAIELDPSSAEAHQGYAEYLRNLGRFEEALVEVQRAQDLDPLSAYAHIERGIILYLAGRYDEALAQYRRLLRATPSFTYAYFFMALAHIQEGEHDAALSALNALDPEGVRPDAVTIRGVAHAMAGRRDEARQMLETLGTLAENQPVSPFQLASIHLHLGERERALDLLERAAEERSWHARMLKVEPIFQSLRPEPRFQALLERVGLGS